MSTRVPFNPESTPLGDWFQHHIRVRATCQCGRVTVLHNGNLIHKFGYQKTFNARQLAEFSESCVCIRCQGRGPKLELVIIKD
jgi:hypothetical protein